MLLAIAVAVAGCHSRYAIPAHGRFIDVRHARGDRLFVVVDASQVEALRDVFAAASPSAPSPETEADFVFTEILDGAVVKRVELYRGGEIFTDGKWSRADEGWLQSWRVMYDPAHVKKPNQSPEPTPTAGTSAAEQPLVPAAVVAHL